MTCVAFRDCRGFIAALGALRKGLIEALTITSMLESVADYARVNIVKLACMFAWKVISINP